MMLLVACAKCLPECIKVLMIALLNKSSEKKQISTKIAAVFHVTVFVILKIVAVFHVAVFVVLFLGWFVVLVLVLMVSQLHFFHWVILCPFIFCLLMKNFPLTFVSAT